MKSFLQKDPHRRESRDTGDRWKTPHLYSGDGNPNVIAQRATAEALNQAPRVRSHIEMQEALNRRPQVVAQNRLAERLGTVQRVVDINTPPDTRLRITNRSASDFGREVIVVRKSRSQRDKLVVRYAGSEDPDLDGYDGYRVHVNELDPIGQHQIEEEEDEKDHPVMTDSSSMAFTESVGGNALGQSLANLTRSGNGIEGVFFAGNLAFKADDGSYQKALQLMQRLGVPGPVALGFLNAESLDARELRKAIHTKLGLTIGDTVGFVVMNKIAGKDFTELNPGEKAGLKSPQALMDLGKIYAFQSLIGSSDDFTTGNWSNLFLGATGPTLIDQQLDEMVDPEEAGEWAQGFKKEIEERGVADSPRLKGLTDIIKEFLGAELSADLTPQDAHAHLLAGIRSVLESAQTVAVDPESESLEGKLLLSIQKKLKAIS